MFVARTRAQLEDLLETAQANLNHDFHLGSHGPFFFLSYVVSRWHFKTNILGDTASVVNTGTVTMITGSGPGSPSVNQRLHNAG